jgi:ribose 5-phosphate isomerase A
MAAHFTCFIVISLPCQGFMMSDQHAQKQAAAKAALRYIEDDMILGVGTGSTVNCLIELLPSLKLAGAVASSQVTEDRLKALGIEIVDLNFAGTLDVYIDGADEVNEHLQLIKGGGGALTREKIVAAASNKFICMVDDSKMVKFLGREFPVPIEVLPQARSYVARQLAQMGGEPVYRENFVTDYGNVILDTYDLDVSNPLALEQQLNNIVGVVCNGVFAANQADVLLKANSTGVDVLMRS